jgi:outer membrane protein assembly factor BamE (lipoprotein component of BamABCDE complex)
MIRTGVVSCFIVVLLTSGCALSKEARIDRLESKYPQWDQNTIEKVAERRVEVGMTEDMVREAKGRPAAISHDGDVTIWEYVCLGMDLEGRTRRVPCLYVNFRNGRVTGTHLG